MNRPRHWCRFLKPESGSLSDPRIASAFGCDNLIWVCPPITIFWEPCPAILPMECHRALGCGHASLANADAKHQPKLRLVARPLPRSLRGLLFSLCLGFRTRGRLYPRRFWKRLRPNMGRLHVSPARSEFRGRQATPILGPFPKASRKNSDNDNRACDRLSNDVCVFALYCF